MISSPQIEPVSTEQFLAILCLAINEVKLDRSLVQIKESATKVEAEKPSPRKLMLLNREIELLEAKLAQVRSQANRG